MVQAVHARPSVREQVSEEEWALRVDLAAAYRLVHHYGWTDMIFTHLSARVPGPEHHFLINPFGMMFDEVTASDLVKIDLDGNVIHAPSAIVDLVHGAFRRVVQNAAGVTIDLSENARLFTGLARLGVELQADECFWPGCHKPTSRCQIDHTRPAARGGPTTQSNGLPACIRHNLIKEAGYTVTRRHDGSIHILTPDGETVR